MKSQSSSRTLTARCGTDCAASRSRSAPARCAASASTSHRVDDAQHVGDVAHRDDAHARRELGHEVVDVDAAVVGQSEIANDAARSPSEVLPREHVRRVLADSDEDLVALADVARSPSGGDEVDRFGRAAREGDLERIGGADEACYGCSRVVVALVRVAGEGVEGRRRVGVFAFVERRDRVDHLARAVGRGGGVEVDDLASVDRLGQARGSGFAKLRRSTPVNQRGLASYAPDDSIESMELLTYLGVENAASAPPKSRRSR